MRRNNGTELVTRHTRWIRLAGETPTSVRRVLHAHHLSQDLVDTILASNRRSRLLVDTNAVLLVFVYPRYDTTLRRVRICELDAVLVGHTLITVEQTANEDVRACFERLSDRPSPHELQHPAKVLGGILHTLSTGTYEMLDVIAKRSDAVERSLVQGEQGRHEEILATQTAIIDIRKLVESDAIVFARLLDSVRGSARAYLAPTIEALEQLATEIRINIRTELATAEALERTHESMIAERTNRLIRTLTVVTLVLMPATLLGGIFGMNTKSPWILGLPQDFSIIISVMIASALAVFFLLRVRNW